MVTSKTRWVETATATKKSAINSKKLRATWLPAEIIHKTTDKCNSKLLQWHRSPAAQYTKQEVLKIRLVTYIASQTRQWSVCSKNCPFYDELLDCMVLQVPPTTPKEGRLVNGDSTEFIKWQLTHIDVTIFKLHFLYFNKLKYSLSIIKHIKIFCWNHFVDGFLYINSTLEAYIILFPFTLGYRNVW